MANDYPLTTNTYLFMRWSDPKQSAGDSRERQTRNGLAYIERMGWSLADTPNAVFGDDGKSGYHGDHLKGEFGRFTEGVRQGLYPRGTILVAEKLDRLGRLGIDATRDWLREMTRLGLCVATFMDGRFYDENSFKNGDPNELTNSIITDIEAWTARQYSKTISERVSEKWVRKREAALRDGTIVSAHCPGWLRVITLPDGKRAFEVIEERADIVRIVYERCAEGWGFRAIAGWLNEKGYRPWGRRHHHKKSKTPGFEHTYLGDIIRSEAPEGVYKPGTGRKSYRSPTGERREDYYPRIVDADVVARAKTAMRQRQGLGGRGKDQLRNLFSGLCYCSCGSKLRSMGSAKRPAGYLVCQDAYDKRRTDEGLACTHRDTFDYPKFEKAVLDAVLHLALDQRSFERPDETRRLAITAAELEKTAALKRDSVKALGRQLAGPRKDDAILGELYDEAKAELDALTAQTKEAKAELEKARGTVSPKEHMKRVLGVRASLDHPDYDTRLKARKMVVEAMRGVGFRAIASAPGALAADDLRKLFYVELGAATPDAEPMHTLWITNEGEVLDEEVRPDWVIEAWTEASPTALGYLRRRKANAA